MNIIYTIAKREFFGYFETPLAFVFLMIFLLFQGIFTFYLGQFLEREQASLESFFIWLPWLLMFFVPAIGMRLWPEERKEGTLEMLWALPVPMYRIVIAKYVAALSFLWLAIALTFPFWLIVQYLGNPDNSIIITGYIGSFMIAGGYLAIAMAVSSLTRNQVIAFILALAACFFFTVTSFPLVLDFFSKWLSQDLLDVVAYFSFITHMDEMARGLISFQQLVFFASLILLCLYLNTLMLHSRRQ
ncbi:MAG: ABC transporter permease subunit [Alphaproteobacteria bacterium]|nr:ABC transporter permease subunit [Alphaproteobacteria bacterium]